MIPVGEPSLGEEELSNVVEAIKSNWISSSGKFIEKFENDFSSYCGRRYGNATSNGTVSLHLALEALGISKSDEVIVPDLTFIAAANAVTYCNAKPIFVDSHPSYWCIDPEKIEEKITSKTKAIIPVHLYGHPCDMDPIINIAEEYGLYIIEDAAEAHGAEYKGKKIGSFGHVSCFSFYGNKIITTGEGGMCLTDDEELSKRIRILRDHGKNPNKKYWHDVIGYNYRLTNLQAAVGVAQLKKLERFVEKKREIAKLYAGLLNELVEENIVELQPEMNWAKSIYWMNSILIKNKLRIERDNLIKILEKKSIETRPFFYPLHMMPPYQCEGKFPVAQKISASGINLPSSVNLKVEEIKIIVDTIKDCIEYENKFDNYSKEII